MTKAKNFLTRDDFIRNNHLKFQKYGVKIGIRAAELIHLKEIYSTLEKVFPRGLEPLAGEEIEYRFEIESETGKPLKLRLNGEELFEHETEKLFFDMLESRIRVTIAEFAVGKVFLHAGVVGWKGRAIIIPATSFAGKTTLVAELVKKGADYYSDEYAVLDAEGNVEPFPKWLSLRGIVDAVTQVECSVESIGGVAAIKTIPVGMILIARYKNGKSIPKKWRPKRLSPGEGIMEILPHTMTIRNKPKFVLEVLNKSVNRAIIVKTVRGEAAEFAESLLGYFESQTK